MEYDIEKQFFTKFSSEMEMDLVTELEGFGIELKVKNLTTQTTQIEARR